MKFINQKALFIPLCLLFSVIQYSSSFADDKKHEYDQIQLKLSETIDWVYREDYVTADSVTQSIIDQYPESPSGYFMKAVISLKKGFYLKNYEEYNDTTMMWLKKAINKSKKQIKNYSHDANAYFFAGGAYGYEGAIYARQKKWIKTGLSALRGIRYLETALAMDSTLYDIYFGSGLYHVVAGNQKGIVRFIQRLLPIPNGDANLGFKHLNIAVQKGKFTSVVAIETLAFAHIHYTKRFDKAIDLLNSLLERYPNSLEFYTMIANARFYYALNYNYNEWQNLKNDIATVRGFIKERKMDFYQWWLDKFDFMEAFIYFVEQEYVKALFLFEDYTEKYSKKNSSYLTALSHLMIGKIYDLQGNRKAAVVAYKKVEKYETFGNVEKLADLFMKTPYNGESYRTRFRGAFTHIPDRP